MLFWYGLPSQFKIKLCLWFIDLFYCVYIISYWWFQIIYCHTIRVSSRLPKASRDIFLAKPHYSDVIMSAMAPQITGVSIVYSTVYSCTDQRNHQSSASLVFVRGIYRWPVNSLHKGPVIRKKFPFDDVIMRASFRLLEFPALRRDFRITFVSKAGYWYDDRVNDEFEIWQRRHFWPAPSYHNLNQWQLLSPQHGLLPRVICALECQCGSRIKWDT